MKLEELLEQIRSPDPRTRTAAWQEAGSIGARAVQPLAQLAVGEDMEVARAARRGLEKIVRTVGRAGEGKRREPVIAEFLGLLAKNHPATLRRDVLWLLSEIGGEESIEPIAGLLEEEDVREDARMALERIPGEKALGALRKALESVPEDFRLNVAHSLRARGVEVDLEKYPCQKLLPTR